MKRMKSLWIAVLLLMVSTTVSAQCTFRNTAFKSGEFLQLFWRQVSCQDASSAQ